MVVINLCHTVDARLRSGGSPIIIIIATIHAVEKCTGRCSSPPHVPGGCIGDSSVGCVCTTCCRDIHGSHIANGCRDPFDSCVVPRRSRCFAIDTRLTPADLSGFAELGCTELTLRSLNVAEGAFHECTVPPTDGVPRRVGGIVSHSSCCICGGRRCGGVPCCCCVPAGLPR